MRKSKSPRKPAPAAPPDTGAIRRLEGRLNAGFARFAVVATQWYDEILDGLIAGALQTLRAAGAETRNITLIRVPGAFELPLALEHAAASGKYDALIALGCVIRGGTPHFEYVAGECARGVAQVMLSYRLPVTFGVLTTDNLKQARERSRAGRDNKGREAAEAAIRMLSVLRQLND
ncbi:MAG TPA: 6,7-dimethyl-8-ribityllumazine synthase [Nevskiales bacterium]|nr:6,7-dimethyl-8-ribityllumazine synthase [Nevskiales bacterium]